MNKLPLSVLLFSALLSGVAAAQSVPEPIDLLAGRPDREVARPGAIALAPAFESESAGISLQPPVGGRAIDRPGDAEIVRFVYEGDESVLAVVSVTLPEPVPLTALTTPDAPPEGMLERAAAEFKRAHVAGQIVRQDLTNVGDGSVGMLVARYTLGTNSFLHQQAIVQASDRLYYTITYVTPGARPEPGNDEVDPKEQQAVDTFAAVLDTVRLLDRSHIKVDQDQRLYRTRAFYVNLSQKTLEAALVPEQWFRIVTDGKDIGYLYVVEEKTKLAGLPAVKVGLRSRTFDERNRQIDAEAWLQMSTDRKHEQWSRLSVVTDGATKTHATEIGTSDLATRVVAEQLDRDQQIAGVKPGIRMVEQYPLTVKYAASTGAPEPVERQLPPWYMPQALGHLLPRVLPLGERKGYLFATFVPDRREVMMRYVDLQTERQVTFAGKTLRATPVQEKIGLDGYVTTHYLDDAGRYLGSESKFPDEAGKMLTVSYVATTADELNARWKDVNLTRPTETGAAVQPGTGEGR
jgi:hypothetical protein